MNEQRDRIVMWGILICLAIIALSLLIIALKPVPQLSISNPPYLPSRDEVIQLGSDRIAVMDVSHDSGTYGKIAILDYDAKNGSFKLVGEFDYHRFSSAVYIPQKINHFFIKSSL